jgi:hypothetical protein
MAPSDIQATLFNGQPFTAATPSGVRFKMTFTPDGQMTREPLAVSGSKSAGAWKPNAQGFCTSWGSARRRVAFTVVPIGENKWNRDYYRRHGCCLVQITIGTLPRVRAVQRSVVIVSRTLRMNAAHAIPSQSGSVARVARRSRCDKL